MAMSLDVRSLTVELPTRAGWVRPVNEVSFALGAGETLGIVGESGSGKTMLALALMGLEPPGARLYGEAWLSARAANGNGSSAPARNNLLTASRSTMWALRGGGADTMQLRWILRMRRRGADRDRLSIRAGLRLGPGMRRRKM